MAYINIWFWRCMHQEATLNLRKLSVVPNNAKIVVKNWARRSQKWRLSFARKDALSIFPTYAQSQYTRATDVSHDACHENCKWNSADLSLNLGCIWWGQHNHARIGIRNICLKTTLRKYKTDHNVLSLVCAYVCQKKTWRKFNNDERTTSVSTEPKL